MAELKLPSREYLLKRLRYEPETGKLYWLPRTPDMFANGNIGCDANCSAWNRKYAGNEAMRQTALGYRTGRLDNVEYRAHRIIWKIMTGDDPNVIDHINGDRLDNRWSNLRSGTHADNRLNSGRHGRNTSGVSGVSWAKHTGRWRALISKNGHRHHLGYFEDFDAALAAREEAKKRLGFTERHGIKESVK